MSWSVNESSYSLETSIKEMEKREFEINYQNRGAYEPQPIRIRVLSSDRVFDDADAARNYIREHIRHGESACVKYKVPVSTYDKKSKTYIDRIRREIDSLFEYSEKHTVDKQKAQFIGCKTCGSKLSRTHLKRINGCLTRYNSFLPVENECSGYSIISALNPCPVCGGYLQSDSVIEEITRREKKIVSIRDKYREHLKTRPNKIMWFVFSQLYIG